MVAAYQEYGRDPDTIDITLFGCRQDKDEMQRFMDAGYSHIVCVETGATGYDEGQTVSPGGACYER